MPDVPPPPAWKPQRAKCEAELKSYIADLKTAEASKAAHIAGHAKYEKRRVEVCTSVGYDLQKGGEGPKRKAAEDAMAADKTLQAMFKKLEELEAKMPPPSPSKLKKELDAYEKMLNGPSLTDSKNKPMPGMEKNIKIKKEGIEFITQTRTAYKIR